MSYGLKGKKIIVPSHTAPATIIGILNAGCIPIYCEIDEHSLLISPSHARILLEKESDIAGIVAVNLYGFSVDIVALKKLAKEYSIRLIEDCAQSTGTTFKHKMSGTIADGGTFSFFPTKNLSTIGDGGALWLPNKSIAKKARSLCQYGWNSKRIVINEHGINSRLSEIQSAILNIKLKYLNQNITLRKKIAKNYDALLTNNVLIKPKINKYNSHAYHLYVVSYKKRDLLIKFLKKRGIFLSIQYPVPIHKMNAFNKGLNKFDKNNLGNSESLSRSIFSLPIYPTLKKKRST